MKTVLLLIGSILASIHFAEAQQTKRVSRIGYLTELDAATESTRAQAIRLALRERGHIEGQNITIEYRYMEGKRDWAPDLLAELVRLKVDIVVAAGRGTIQAAKNATKTIPVVMAGEGVDPVAAGLVESLARPGGNITGFTYLQGATRREAARAAQKPFPRVPMFNDLERQGGLRSERKQPGGGR